jgi:hypothetical protein
MPSPPVLAGAGTRLDDGNVDVVANIDARKGNRPSPRMSPGRHCAVARSQAMNPAAATLC